MQPTREETSAKGYSTCTFNVAMSTTLSNVICIVILKEELLYNLNHIIRFLKLPIGYE